MAIKGGKLMQDEDLRICPFQQLSFKHAWFIVPAYSEIPVSETLTMQYLCSEIKIRRKTIKRLCHGSSPGDILHIKGTKNRMLVCVVLAQSPARLTYKTLYRYLIKCLRSTVDDTAIIGDGFRIPSKSKHRDDIENGFELLCRALRRIGFSGIVYEPPEYRLSASDCHDYVDERITNTRMIITPSGNIDSGLMPDLQKLRKSSSD
ncbi:hypothetical protein GF391_03700 [Candidatus Uhrbacteria bacterium]|nr:hypothetical protein [Candidatus Uhrbacteria bacterium]